ncbi:MAG TPA: class I SAM-dependent methyltransferase [Elusimicrobiota bacterium]|nr:class I SAM-dependent methyltransferase [Elusimicrobiota bacterium]
MTAAMALENVACNLCGSRRFKTLRDRPYASSNSSDCAATTDQYQAYGRIVRCQDCGLVFTNPRPGAADLLSGYSGCTDQTYLTEASSRSINAHFSLNTIRRFAKGGRLLEIGASTGCFLNAARVDFEVVGLEPSQWACRVARERFRLECYAEGIQATTRFAPASFDVVALIDVIEHLPDPAAAVRKAAELLRPGGLLYVVTPDIESFSSKILGGYWWGLRPAHIYYFSAKTLGRLLAQSGFEVVLNKSFGRIFTWGYWASRLRHYPRWLYAGTLRIIARLDIERKFVYFDTRDSMEICAVKRS